MTYRNLIFAAFALTFVVVVVGAYVRLHDAGLGCPDWPGCYGHWVGVPEQAEELERAAQAFPGKPVEVQKAWREMFHRYLAGILGLLILAIAVAAWRRGDKERESPLLATTLVFVVGFQAVLGMWTVTMLLKPAIVTLHLLGGMTTLALVTWLLLRQVGVAAAPVHTRTLKPWAIGGLVVAAAQIALGGWVSANDAALACLDFPTCRGAWIPSMDFEHAFHVTRELGETAAGTPLSLEALTAIHWTHRVGAAIALLYIVTLALLVMKTRALARYGTALIVVLIVQVGLGVANVVLKLPLPIAVAHNAGAAALLVTLVVLNFALSGTRSPRSISR